MKFFDKIFRKRLENNSTQLPTAYNVEPRRKAKEYNITREDGECVTIKPVLDKVGNQFYEQVFNSRTQQMQSIPRFIIMAEELKRLIGPQALGLSVLIDINPKDLDNPEFGEYIVNKMLNSDRMSKVINQYHNYVGCVMAHENGVYEKIVDYGIINTLASNKQKYYSDYERRITEEMEKMKKQAQSMPVHYKTCHASDLSQDDGGRDR